MTYPMLSDSSGWITVSAMTAVWNSVRVRDQRWFVCAKDNYRKDLWTAV